jgi:zinc protease
MRIGFIAVTSLFLTVTAYSASAAVLDQENEFHVDSTYHTLDNGLRVVLAEDHTVPTATVAVYYNVGYRNEPRGQTGFAHLFEHLFFTGSQNIPGEGFGEFIAGIGGLTNGSTRLDFTNYYSVVPAHALQSLLWAEADRMGYPTLSQIALDQQREVVRNEIFVNVLNQPYGGASWIDLPMAANQNWYNAHNFYGDLTDLDDANLDEAQAFFSTYYRPRNAVLVVAGAFDHDETLAYVERLFGPIPAGDPMPVIDVSEPRQEAERHGELTTTLSPHSGVVIGYHMPERDTPEFYAMVIIDQMMRAGGDAILRRRLVDETGLAGSLSGGINLLGTNFNYEGPMLWSVSMRFDDAHSYGAVQAEFDRNIENLRTRRVSEADLSRSRSKLMIEFYARLDYSTRFGLVDLLASFALFEDDPSQINNISDGFEHVTPELVMATAREYLRPENRTILRLIPVEPDPTETDDAPSHQPRSGQVHALQPTVSTGENR